MVVLPAPYPLCWPEGRGRIEAKDRVSSAFKVDTQAAVRDLVKELNALGRRYSITSDVVGIGAGLPEDPGVAVWLEVNGELRCICCDEYRQLRENIRAVGLTLGALRAVDRYGATMLDQVLGSVVAALPLRGSEDLFGGVATVADIEARYRELSKTMHPDGGGTTAEFVMLQEQKATALRRARG